jgi:hypothetical protein
VSQTLSKIAADVAAETGINIDTTSMLDSTDKATKEFVAIANRLAREIADAHAWPVLQKQGEFILIDGDSTYALAGDLNWILHETMWNQDQAWQLYGPYSPQDRQFLKSGVIESYPFQRFTIRGLTSKRIEIDPTPTADEDGQVLVYEYTSLRPVKPRAWESGINVTVGDYCESEGVYYTASTNGTTGSTAPTIFTGNDGSVGWTYYGGAYTRFLADTDEPVINPTTFSQGVLERFSERHGVQIKPRYEAQLLRDMEKSKPGRKVDMLRRRRIRYPNAPGTEWAS